MPFAFQTEKPEIDIGCIRFPGVDIRFGKGGGAVIVLDVF